MNSILTRRTLLTLAVFLTTMVFSITLSDKAEAQPTIASHYGPELAGNFTASGEPFEPYGLTTAHKFLPLGTLVLVCNPDNGACVTARVNDRGPFAGDREYDLSFGVGLAIGTLEKGVCSVDITVLG